ncbi:hypothetical protein CN918_26765 [Priestia megaterium]|nr:hypothetical protein CN918_26765 [Priestia megaterium]
MDILHEIMRKNNVNIPYEINEEQTGSPGSYDYFKEKFIFRPYQIQKVKDEFNQKFNCSLTLSHMGQIVASHEIGHAADPFLSTRMSASHKHHYYAKTNLFHEDNRSKIEFKKYARLKMTCEHTAWQKAPLYLLSPIPQHDYNLFQQYCLKTYSNSFQHEYMSLLIVSYLMKSFESWSYFFPLGTSLNYRYNSSEDSFYNESTQSFTISFNHLLAKKTPDFHPLSTYSFALYQFVYEYLSSLSSATQRKKEKLLLDSQTTTLRDFVEYKKESLQQETQILNKMAIQFPSPSFHKFYTFSLKRKEAELVELQERLFTSLFIPSF